MSVLRCEGLRKCFDGVEALSGVDLEFAAPGIVGIIGPNGAGKSTLTHVLSGFLRPDAGRCVVGDTETTGLAAHRVARLGVARTFQDLRVIGRLSVLDNVLVHTPGLRGERLWRSLLFGEQTAEAVSNRELALQQLSFVGLEDVAGQPAGALSYGRQKLLSLACALVRAPKVLLLDEPVAGVHVDTRAKIVSLLRELRAHGLLILLIEHDLVTVREASDEVIVMDRGRVIARGVLADVLDRKDVVDAYVT